jgi:hypothetical protein
MARSASLLWSDPATADDLSDCAESEIARREVRSMLRYRPMPNSFRAFSTKL